MRHGKSNSCHNNGDDDGESKCDSLNSLNCAHIALSKVLGTQKCCSCSQSVINHK